MKVTKLHIRIFGWSISFVCQVVDSEQNVM